MKYTLAGLRAEYNRRWTEMRIRETWTAEIADTVQRIRRGVEEYVRITEATGVPWYVIGLIHELESNCSFTRHLHNGDVLTSRTKNVPKGRPTKGEPPFTFIASAIDALKLDGLMRWDDWSIAGISYKLEGFNGFGYRQYKVPSPYLYSGSHWYTKGKYISDGVFDRDRVSKQVGALVILKSLEASGGFSIEVR